MPLRSSLRRVAVALVLVATFAVGSGEASAQNQVEAPHKGLIGLGILGAELGFVVPTAFGYDETWSLITLPIVGAAGGAVGGFYLDRAGSPAASVSVLVLSLAFAVPTIMLTVNATRYSTDDLERDTESRAVDPRRYAGTGLVRRYGGRFHLAMPGLDVAPVHRATASAGLELAGAEFRLTFVSGAF